MWNDIELSTNDDTVTGRLCIDSRHECGTALYQVDTLVKVSSSDKVLSNPNLYASSSSNGCVVVADKSVILLDQNCQSVLLQLQFETQVDGVGLCQEGRFLVVAERNGNLHLHHVPSKKTVLTNALVQKPYNEDQKTYRNLIIQEDDPGTYHMFVLTSDGFFHISNLQLAKIQQGVRKCQILDNLIFVLDDENILSMWDAYTLVLVWYWPSVCIQDFLLTTEGESASVAMLSRLLYKHKFEEAERFAIQFGLDVELVYKVKLNFVLERLASASIGGYGQTVWVELVNEAKENLHKIPDDQFIVQYCIKAPWPTFETAQEMLNYAKSRILKKDDRKNAAFLEDLPILLTEILGALAKLSTFYGAFGPEKFSGISWIEFLNNKDVLSDIFWHLEERNLKCAQYLWLRHQPEFESQFDVEALEKLLNIIPADIPSRELCLWFKSVIISFVRRIVPKGQSNWPENGLEMAELYFVSRNPNELGLSSSWLWIPLKEDGDCEEVHQLKTLVGSLQQLLDLYKKYKCILPLSEFEKENKTTIAFRMLDKVLAPELIPPTLEKVIKPYIQVHNLQLEELLLQYIKDLLERCSSQSASLFETEWEAKAMAVLGCMSDTDLVFDAVLQIMYGAVVPWSEAVEQLVKQHLEMDHPKVKLLQESYRLMEMKKLLRGYGIRSFNLSDDKQIMKLVKYILKQDLPSSLEDALKVAQAYMLPTVEVCILRIVYLIGQDKVDECLKLLKTLPSDEAESTAERLAIWARLELHDQRDTSEEHKKHQMAVARTMVEILKFLQDIQKDSTLKRMQCENNLNMFEAIANLQEDFDIFLSLEDYENRTLLSQLREKHIETYENTLSRSKTEKTSVVAKGQDGKTKTISTESGLYRLALLLQLTEQELGAELAMRALAVGKVEKALKICRQCQIDDYGFIAKTSSLGADRDPYDEWTFEDFFNEDGIVLDPVMVLPVLYEITTNVVPYTAGKKHYPLDCSCLTNCPYVEEVNFLKPMRSPMNSMLQNLQECSQLELVLRLVVNSFGTCLQHVISNNMDMALSAKLYDRRNLVEDRDFIVAMGEKTVSVIKDVSLALLHKVFNCRVIDCDLALGYCTLLPKKDVFEKLWHVINNTWQNYNKVLAVAVVGAHLSDLYKDEEHRQTFLSLIADAEWGIHLGKLGISFQSVFRQCPARKKDLISTLVKNPNVNSELILKYCRTFDLDSDSALHLYIETLLLHGTNILHNEDDPTLEKNTKLSHSEYVAKALEIIPLLNRTSNLVISLSATIHKLSPYDYETIHGVLKVIQTADEKTTSIQIEQAIGLLQHLNSYRRISPPVDLEHHYILEKSLEVSAYAQSRLPFHLIFFKTTQCFWKIISVELCEESFPTLLLISKLMKVCIDKLYMSAVNHVFEKSLKPNSLKQSKEGHTFLMTKETAKTVQTIKGYLLSITNPEWAAATSHRIAQALPTGPDKTSALKFCLHLAEKWLKATGAEDKTHAKAEVFLEKLKVQYQRSATENILIAFNLSTPEYLKLTGFPAKLIVSLYEHNSIEQRIQNPTGKDYPGFPAKLIVSLYEHNSIEQRIQNPTGKDYPDIHAAAKEIAEINNIDISKIRDVLLEKWLCRNSQPSTDPISTSGARLTFAHRSRALLCLIQVADEETVVSLIKMPIEKVKYYLKCCIYLAEFELLNIPYTVESFHNSPKEGMIKGLWKNHSHEPRAVRLVTELSLEYQVYDPQLWNGVLQKLLSFSMISYMRKVLVAITAVHSLWQV
ncbi:UNVERIFIED_CONTAM: hypothetical protein FKN15_023799 [Acipenser sinensis]